MLGQVTTVCLKLEQVKPGLGMLGQVRQV